MELYKSISRIVATALFAASLVILSISFPVSETPDPSMQWRIGIKDPEFNVLSVEGKVFGRTGRKFPFSAIVTETGSRLQPIGLAAYAADGSSLDVDRTEGGWEVECLDGDFTVRYDVVLTIEDRYSPEVRGMISSLGPGRSRLMGRDVFLMPGRPVSGRILVDVDLHGGRAIGSPWESVGTRMIVPSAADLPATLAAAGDFRYLEVFESGVRLVLATGGEWDFDDAELLETVRRIVSEEIAMFGSSPREKHLVICDHNPVKGGKGFGYYGMHFGGTILLLLDPAIDRSELYGAPMSIIAHEFFHNWNGEALRPSDGSFMWFTEGATVYYSYRVLRAAGIISGGQYLSFEKGIEERFTENPLRGSIRLTGAGNSDLADRAMVNFLYDGGFLAARAIDERIASATGGASGLIDVIRRLYIEDSGGREIGLAELEGAILIETGSSFSAFIEAVLDDPMADAPLDVSS